MTDGELEADELRGFPRGLLHDLVVTVTHELAHLLVSGGGHGPNWRDAHMGLLQQVYADAMQQQPGGYGARRACAACRGGAGS